MYSSARAPYEHPALASYCCTGCDKQYSTAHHLDSHQRSGCAVTKRSLAELLEGTKRFWESRKKRRIMGAPSEQAEALLPTPPGDMMPPNISVSLQDGSPLHSREEHL